MEDEDPVSQRFRTNHSDQHFLIFQRAQVELTDFNFLPNETKKYSRTNCKSMKKKLLTSIDGSKLSTRGV